MIAYTTLACAAVQDLTIYFCRPNVSSLSPNRPISCRPNGHLGKICRPNVLSPKWPYTPSATGRPIYFMFCSRVGFLGTADLMALFSIRTNSRWRPPPSWIISTGHISATAHDLLRSV